MYTDRNTSKLLDNLLRYTFPSWDGKKVTIEPTDKITLVFTSGQSHIVYQVVNLNDFVIESIPFVPDPVFGGPDKPKEYTLKTGYVVVAMTILRHVSTLCQVYVNPEDLPKLLEPPDPLTDHEITVLHFSSTIAARADQRYLEARKATAINREEWDNATECLKAKGYLSRHGAVTRAGTNALQWHEEYVEKKGGKRAGKK